MGPQEKKKSSDYFVRRPYHEKRLGLGAYSFPDPGLGPVIKKKMADSGAPTVDEMAGKGGFSFDNCRRNVALERMGLKKPRATKTGTTLAGVVYKDGIVLGADTRSTDDTTAADTENTTGLISSRLELHRRATGRESRVVTAKTMLKQFLFRYQGHISAALVLGGVDITGPHLYMIYPHGSTDQLPYVTMGSGSLAAMAVFEADYKKDMTREEAIALVSRAIRGGIFNDLGSGSNVDICVIASPDAEESPSDAATTTKGGVTVDYLRNHQLFWERPYRRIMPAQLNRGTTAVLTSERKRIDLAKLGIVVENGNTLDGDADVADMD